MDVFVFLPSRNTARLVADENHVPGPLRAQRVASLVQKWNS